MPFFTIHPQEIPAILRQKKAIVIDVRERTYFMEYHYEGAVSCPYEEIDRWIGRFPGGSALILYCEYGSTSLLAARKLSQAGYEVYTVVGGISAIRAYLEKQKEKKPAESGCYRPMKSKKRDFPMNND